MAHTEEMMINGVLTRVTKFDQSAKNIDDAASKGLWQVNQNLLDNAYFLNPVNQKGLTEYSGAIYGIDRWKGTNSSTAYTLTENGLKFTASNLRFTQLLERPDLLIGKTLTLSALVTENAGTEAMHFAKMVSGAHTSLVAVPVGKTGMFSATFTPEEGFEGIRIYTGSGYTGSTTVAAMKLELGDTQTFAHQGNEGNWVLNEIPDFKTELLKCQRYQFRASVKFGVPGTGYAVSATAANIVIPLPATMRNAGNPIPGFSGLYLIGAGHGGGSAIPVTEIASSQYCENTMMVQAICAGGLTAGAAVSFQLRTDDGYLLIDANL